MEKLVPTILFENDDVLVINKPAGLVVHGDGRGDYYSLADWVIENYPGMASVGESMVRQLAEDPNESIKIPRPGIVHRLDKETSGVMILAKNDRSFGYLKKQFLEHKIQKTYRAFLYGHVTKDMGTIDAPIGRNSGDIRKWVAGRGGHTAIREANTQYRVINRGKDSTGEKVTYVEAYPMTGRTHQLRAHFVYINHPIVSDYLYAGQKPKLLGFGRVALHSLKLKIAISPGNVHVFEAPLPVDFVNAEALMQLAD
ncbi:MAG: RluA family pseudouridine synthase [Minisyncoccia bacterium]